MNKIDDGGSAFPRTNTAGMTEHKGMSLRVWLAGQALIGLIAQCDPPAKDEKNFEDFADWTFEMADAMIARSKEDSQCKDAGGSK